MKHTMTITWESRRTSDDVLDKHAFEFGLIGFRATEMVRDWVDSDAHVLRVIVDGVTMAEQGGSHV